MSHPVLVRSLSVLGLCASAGCAVVPDTDPSKTLLSGSGDIFNRAMFEEQSLCTTLQQFGLAAPSEEDVASIAEGRTLLGKVQTLRTDVTICEIHLENAKNAETRNLFQDYVMALSDQRCGAYKRQILDRRASWHLFFGGWATVLGGAGAVFSPESTAKALSAASAVLSGVRSEYDQAYFSNLATEVITAGIDQRRLDIRNEIASSREEAATSTSDYTVGAALRDALRYHASCSAVSGLEVAKDSISLNEDPGLEGFNRSLELLNLRVSGLSLEVIPASEGNQAGEQSGQPPGDEEPTPGDGDDNDAEPAPGDGDDDEDAAGDQVIENPDDNAA